MDDKTAIVVVSVAVVVVIICLAVMAYCDRRAKALWAEGDAHMAKARAILASIPGEVAKAMRASSTPLSTVLDDVNLSAKESNMLLNVLHTRDLALALTMLAPGSVAVCRRLVERGLMESYAEPKDFTEAPGYCLSELGLARAYQLQSQLTTSYPERRG